MKSITLRLHLKSAATFGRGDGVAGLIDREIEHDRHGFPYLRGKTLKGLLAESAENLAYALDLQGQIHWWDVKHKLFGRPGRGQTERGTMHVGDACLPAAFTSLVREAQVNQPDSFSPEQVLASLTGIRRQTAINPDGGPDHKTLRAMRVLVKGVLLEAALTFEESLSPVEMAFLAATVLDFRRAGTGRNRGRGWLRAELNDKATTRHWFEQFVQEVQR